MLLNAVLSWLYLFVNQETLEETDCSVVPGIKGVDLRRINIIEIISNQHQLLMKCCLFSIINFLSTKKSNKKVLYINCYNSLTMDSSATDCVRWGHKLSSI